MPIVWNEPVSFLQRFTENVLYAYLLDRADECTDPIMRMQVDFIFFLKKFFLNKNYFI